MESLVEAATSETLTAEDWTLIIGICEQVEGSASKAKDAVASLMKRLAHRNVNVVLYSLTLANALVQNCNLNVRLEISSRPFLQQLTKIVENPKTHSTVKNRILDLIQNWTEAFRGESRLDYMGEVYRQLQSQGGSMSLILGFAFPSQQPPTPKKTALSDKDKEEEELQLAMAMSLSEANQPKSSVTPSTSSRASKPNVLFQVKALYDFNPTEEGEIKLLKGQIVDVLDCTTFTDWWKGTLNGHVGIFPSNYVVKIEEAARDGAARRAVPDENAQVLQYAQLVQDFKAAVSKADPLGHNQAENERLQRDYQKIVELVPLVLQRANAQRKKQGRIGALI
ncbi:ESCRT-0 subunit protein hse1 [Kappamyces sp. JEL0829]|nr:ESCRT-0 subunit protein hse1 [Kappamyces sp. JEL0829]